MLIRIINEIMIVSLYERECVIKGGAEETENGNRQTHAHT